MTLARAIVRKWKDLASSQIPAPVLTTARLHLLDVVGVGLAAASRAQGSPYCRVAAGEDGAATALTGARLSDPAMAALVNGGMIHSLEYDDTHTASIIHGSAVLAPVALAMGEARGIRPARCWVAYLLAYEILIRLGLAAPGAFQRNGFQTTSVAGPLAAALLAADLMDADEDACVHAIGIALSQSSGVFEFLTNGSSVKSLHPGWAAHGGMLAARLACAGLTGPETALEGGCGLFSTFARDKAAAARLAEMIDEVGARWLMQEVAFKFYPCCHFLHPFVEAAGLISQVCSWQDIDAITLRIAEGAAPIVCEPWADKIAPVDGHSARWSLPVAVAARLVEGKVDLDTFEQPFSGRVLALAARSRWEPLEHNQFPRAFEAEIEVRLRDGRMIVQRIDDVFGNVSRPASPADVLAKFRANVGSLLGRDDMARVEAFFLNDTPDDFSTFRSAIATTRRSDVS